MRRKFPNQGAWEMQMMKEPELDGVPFSEAKDWLRVSEQELEQLINDDVLNVAEIYNGKGDLVKSLVRTIDIQRLLAKRQAGTKQ
jgi:hypothetical protein